MSAGAVHPISKDEAARLVVAYHYMRRKPPISHAFGLTKSDRVVGVVTFGVPASRHMLIGACPDEPESVVELNRLWVSDDCPRNTESWFLARAFKLMPPRIVLSYADTAEGHMGHVYRAANFYYAGWTDMERKTPRCDHIPEPIRDEAGGLFGFAPDRARHTREASRSGVVRTERRKPKVRYWTTTGNRRQRYRLEQMCRWPKMCWVKSPPPREHSVAAAIRARGET
jgi:hypothetical protein